MGYSDFNALKKALPQAVRFQKNGLAVENVNLLRDAFIDELVYQAVFGKEKAREAAFWVIWAASQALGCGAGSLQGIRNAVGRGQLRGYQLPVIKIPGLAYDAARTAIRAAKALECGILVFEISPEDSRETGVDPAEFAACALGAAIREDWDLPVLLQLGPIPADPRTVLSDLGAFTGSVKSLAEAGVRSGFYNIALESGLSPGSEGTDELNRYRASMADAIGELRRAAPEGIEIAVFWEDGSPEKDSGRLDLNRAVMRGFTELVFDHPHFPSELGEEIRRDAVALSAEASGDPQVIDPFIRKARASGFGTLKRQIWELKQQIRDDITRRMFARLIYTLKGMEVDMTAEVMRRHVIPVPVERQRPERF